MPPPDWSGITLIRYSHPLVWTRYTVVQQQQSEAGAGFDVDEAHRQQGADGWVGGARRVHGVIKPLYVSPLGFPQRSVVTRQTDSEWCYLVEVQTLKQLPIPPASVTEPLGMIEMVLPLIDTTEDWDEPAFQIMEERLLTKEQQTIVEQLLQPFGGELTGSSQRPLLLAPWPRRGDLYQALLQLLSLH